jgi:hypothetical protein
MSFLTFGSVVLDAKQQHPIAKANCNGVPNLM